MKELWDSGQYDAATLMRCMADYFARFRPLSGSTYHRLFEHLSARGGLRETVFSSLNYDCLLEYAARGGQLTISYDSPEPADPPAITVWKIHGSCNFLPEGISASPSGVSYSASSVSWDGGIRIVDCSQVRPSILQNAFYPAMAVFMEGKPIRSNPSVLQQFQNMVVQRRSKRGNGRYHWREAKPVGCPHLGRLIEDKSNTRRRRQFRRIRQMGQAPSQRDAIESRRAEVR